MKHRNLSEKEIVLLLSQKNVKAIEIIYDKYSEVLFGVILQIVRDKRMAEEVLQTTFLKAWINSHKYNPSKGKLFTWLLNIARNASIDKRRSRDYIYSKKTSPLEEHFRQMDNSQHSVHLKTDFIDLAKFYAKLDPSEKKIIELVYFKGFTHTEAAKKLKLPLGTLKTKLRKAIHSLRKWMLIF